MGFWLGLNGFVFGKNEGTNAEARRRRGGRGEGVWIEERLHGDAMHGDASSLTIVDRSRGGMACRIGRVGFVLRF